MSSLPAIFIVIALACGVSACTALTSSNAAYKAHKRLLQGDSATKPAPLNNCDRSSEGIVPDEYVVYLDRGYSLEDHQRTVGDALPEGSFKSHSRLNGSAVYYVTKLDRSSLNAVRSDPRVDFVECERYASYILLM